MENVIEYNNITLGGKEVVIGGWGKYEVEKRSLRAKINGDKYSNYYSNKYIYPQNVIDSVLGGSRHKTSYDTINRFINALREKESKQTELNDVWMIPALSSTRLENFTKEDMYNIDEMQKMNLFLRDYADMMNIQVPLESLSHVSLIKAKPIHISNDNSIMELENRMIPNISTVEHNLGVLASNCDKMRKAITRRKERFGFDSSSEEEYDSDNASCTTSSGESVFGGEDNKDEDNKDEDIENEDIENEDIENEDNDFMKYIYGNEIEDKVENKVENKTENKVENKVEDKTENKTENKVENKTENKVEDINSYIIDKISNII